MGWCETIMKSFLNVRINLSQVFCVEVLHLYINFFEAVPSAKNIRCKYDNKVALLNCGSRLFVLSWRQLNMCLFLSLAEVLQHLMDYFIYGYLCTLKISSALIARRNI